MKEKVFCLLGPTASGKTPLAIKLVQRFPFEIISVDSAMIYKEMDIGTAKPDASELALAPHRLIDFLDPKDSYSAGQFRDDALREIKAILAKDKTPLLVGGTMMYFKSLLHGIAPLPQADEEVRQKIEERAKQEGWPALHAALAKVDPEAASRIHENDAQRIQRALEVFEISGKTITDWQKENEEPLADFDVRVFALMPDDRAWLHERIAKRFDLMLKAGFINEVQQLMDRGDLLPDLPSMRSVGYRQAWAYLSGDISEADMREKAIAATRQLAKRQITWLRSFEDIKTFLPEQDCEADVIEWVSSTL